MLPSTYYLLQETAFDIALHVVILPEDPDQIDRLTVSLANDRPTANEPQQTTLNYLVASFG